MLGNNPIRPVEFGNGDTLAIQEIFPTLQGEGPYTGWPAIFVRLGGCNLACEFCDTEFESFKEQELNNIIERIERFSYVNGQRTAELVVITGGEPFRQPIDKLCETLIDLDYLVQIETNGTLFREIPYGVDIICSPKVSTPKGYFPIREDLLERVSAFKFIISATDDRYSDVPEIGQSQLNIPVYVQPMDEQDDTKNKKNLSKALQLCTEKGYRLSLQTHKILGIP
ncbi:MAG: 7-carboxy-7-deazaguanine synthase QueE [Rickettsiales bacterium]|nr:7-carboxy-7-deazaguanine synthase QueE [Rickettsiales bacterium]